MGDKNDDDKVQILQSNDPRNSEHRKMKSRTKKVLAALTILVVAVVVIVVCVTQLGLDEASNAIQKQEVWQEMRLSRNVFPVKYRLDLNVDLERDVYNGTVSVSVTVEKNTSTVLLHKVRLDIINTHVLEAASNGSSLVPISKTFYYEPNEFWVIELKEDLVGGRNYTVFINFIAYIDNDLSGFYQSSYKKSDGEDVQFAATFFSPISARKAFPCFDEPSFKAVFEISIAHSKKYKALSNMPVSREEDLASDKKKTYFLPSLKMPTYIVCWVVVDFNSVPFDAGKLALRGWAPTNKNTSDLIFGLNVTATLLPKYEVYFDIPFPLDKLDVVTLPAFGPSAMENWGLILFRNSKFLRNAQSTFQNDKTVIQIMGHELVHQWFGNLATMKFWNEAWLKEGFATYIAYIIFDEVYPTKEFMKDVLPDLMLVAMEIDSLATSKPISRILSTPDDIRQVFDSITYYKGCCMVQTMYWYMGKENFRRGMQRYLKTYAYGNADQDDLWHELSLEAEGKDIKALMDTWTKQLGYPVVTTKRINATHLEVEQKRFSLDPPGVEPPDSPFDYQWQIPVITRDFVTNIQSTHLLTQIKAILPINKNEILNPDHSLYYRVNYDDESYAHLTSQLNKNHSVLTALDRTGLVSDNFNLFKAKMKHFEKVLQGLEYIEIESDKAVWDIATRELLEIYGLIHSESHLQVKLGNYIKKIIKATIQRLGWDTQATYKESALQSVLLTTACKLNMTTVVEIARQKYRQWMDGTLDIDKNLYPVMRDCVISNAAQTGGENTYYSYAYKRYMETQDLALLISLTTTQDLILLQRLLEDTMNRTIVKDNDTPYIIGDIALSSENGRNAAWQFIKKRWDELSNRYSDNIFLLGRMLSRVLQRFSSREILVDINEFFEGKTNLGSAQDALHQSILKIKSKIIYKETILEDAWFAIVKS